MEDFFVLHHVCLGVSASDALGAGWDFYAKLQSSSGHWAGDYGGPM